MIVGLGEIKVVTATMPSGSTTSSGVNLHGYRAFALYVPVLTSAGSALFVSPTANETAGLAAWRNGAGVAYTALTPGGTGNAWLGSDVLNFLEAYNGVVQVSASVAQAAARNFVWYLKG